MLCYWAASLTVDKEEKTCSRSALSDERTCFWRYSDDSRGSLSLPVCLDCYRCSFWPKLAVYCISKCKWGLPREFSPDFFFGLISTKRPAAVKSTLLSFRTASRSKGDANEAPASLRANSVINLLLNEWLADWFVDSRTEDRFCLVSKVYACMVGFDYWILGKIV